MVPMGNRTRIATTLLLVMLTLGGGLPHVRCRCPSGRLKPFCLAFLFHSSSACCCAAETASGGCCHAAEASAPEDDEVPSCCAHSCCAVPTGRTAEDTTRIGATCCSRELAPSDEYTASVAPEAVGGEWDWTPHLPAVGSAFLLTDFRGVSDSLAYLPAPPPPDLFTVLQRLTI